MHELSICQSLVRSILEELEKIEPRPEKLISATMVVGELRQIIPEFMEEAYRATTIGTLAEGSKLVLKPVSVQGRCSACEWSGTLPRFEIACPDCGSKDTDLSGGMELFLDNLEIETGDNHEQSKH